MSTSSETRSDQRATIEVVRSAERGHFNHGWLDTYHTFSFGDYYDPSRMGFRSVRVMNEDWVAPSHGFGSHPHRDMEIVTYVLEGTLLHGDSMGNGGPIGAGEMQRITAGTGIFHSEKNPSTTESVHLYQIWILPDRKNHEPGYEQKTFDPEARRGQWQLVASNDGRDGSLTIHQDSSLYLARLPRRGRRLEREIKASDRSRLAPGDPRSGSSSTGIITRGRRRSSHRRRGSTFSVVGLGRLRSPVLRPRLIREASARRPCGCPARKAKRRKEDRWRGSHGSALTSLSSAPDSHAGGVGRIFTQRGCEACGRDR